jgi:hypothetical protein
MIVPLSWLKEYVEIDVTPQELETRLFDCGFEVETLTEVGGEISASGTLTISVNNAQIYAGRVAGCKNVMLGEPSKVLKCRVCSTNGVYYDAEYTAQELADIVKAYRASDAAVAAAKQAAAKRTADAQ